MMNVSVSTAAIATTVVGAQLDFFQEPDALFGLQVRLPDTCRCGLMLALIEGGRGPHRAGLRCACGRHRGWVSVASYRFLTEIVDRFGRPAEPIEIRAPQARMTTSLGADVVKHKQHPAIAPTCAENGD
jgi:hypothetical protein